MTKVFVFVSLALFASMLSACTMGPLDAPVSTCMHTDTSHTVLGGRVLRDDSVYSLNILSLNAHSAPLAQVGLNVHTDSQPGVTATFNGAPLTPEVSFANGVTSIRFADCTELTQADTLIVTVDAHVTVPVLETY